jgi:membrane protein implicated in regulation of membrane protease activity
MYGTFSGVSFSLIAGAALIVIALAFFASPLIAVIIAIILALGFLVVMAALRRRSRGAEQSALSDPGSGPAGPRARGTSGSRATGAPASGEGEIH